MKAWIAMSPTADKIKTKRHAHALTQDDLAARAGVSLATVQRAERGEALSAASLASIAAALDVPAAALAAEEEEAFEPYLPLTPLNTGRQIVSLARASAGMDFGFCEIDDLTDAQAIEALYAFCMALISTSEAFSPIAQVSRELEAKECLSALAARGFSVGAATFVVTTYEVDDDGGMGMPVVFGSWDETRLALRIERTGKEIARAHVLASLGQYEQLKGEAVIYPPRAPIDPSDLFQTETGSPER